MLAGGDGSPVFAGGDGYYLMFGFKPERDGSPVFCNFIYRL